MNFEMERQQRLTEIELILQKLIPKEEGHQKTIMEAMNYSLLAGGKRIRPMLMMETFRLFHGKKKELIEPFMAALEMIHTYSLVHDDLPAMDNDEYRRGRKTTHVVYGEAMAILAGDGLLNYAFETASKAFEVIQTLDEHSLNESNDSNDNSKDNIVNINNQLSYYQRVAKAMTILSSKSGIYGMIGGQVIDIEGFQGSSDRQRLDLMYHLKTGALIEASMMIGAVLAGAKEKEIAIMEQIAGDIGLAFQIKDDILDVTSTQEVLGKPIHSDEKNDKVTYVSILGLDEANQEVLHISERAINAYNELPFDNEYLRLLLLQLIDRKN